MSYEAVIGLEIHTQLATETKAWCNCGIRVNAFENHFVCEVCSAQPGTLPVLNKKVIEFAVRLGLATNCQINHVSFFDRKNYFYPDLPKGYQITQYHTPIAIDGKIDIAGDDFSKTIEIERIQIEEDTGKSTHEGDTSLINLNRAGTPLVEIVTRPNFRSAKEASTFLKKLHSILVYLDVSHGNMQDGNLRCDVNLSLRKMGAKEYGTRTEVKNLNSFRSVEKAIEYEYSRQSQLLDAGEKVLQQTLLFDVETQKTRVLRTKTDADDYRYFPEPDLLPLIVSEAQIKKIKEELPELPYEKAARFVSEYEIPQYDADVLCADKELAKYFEDCCQLYSGEKKKVANWIMAELLGLVNEAQVETKNIHKKISAKALITLISRIDEGKISGKIAKDILQRMFDEQKDVDSLISSMGVEQISDEDKILSMVKKIISDHPAEADEIRGGKDRKLGFFVGLVMKQTGGQANPQMTSDLFKKELGV